MTGFSPSRCKPHALITALSFLFIFNLTTAQTNYYWDPNGAAAGLGGGGTWTDGGLTWRQGATNSETLVAFHYDQTGYANFSGSGTVVVNASTLVGAVLADWSTGIDFVLNSNLNIWGTGQNSIIAGDISGSGGIDFRNTTGYLQLLGTNTFSGSLVSVGRPIYIGDGGTTGSFTSNALLQSGAELIFDRSNDLTYGGTISTDGTGILRKRGEGKLTLTGSLPALGSIQVEEGTLEYGNGGSFYNGTAMDINVGSGATMAYNSDGASASFLASNITGHGTVEKRGTNQLNLSGSITTTAGVHIAEGTLNVFGTGSLHDNRQLSLADVAGATLQLEKNETIGWLTGGGANGGDVNLAFGDLTLATLTGSNPQSFGGDFSGSGALILNSYWNNIFSGDIAHTGGTTINNGTLTVGAGGTRGTLSGNVTNNGTLGFNRSDASSYTGNISGTGALLKSGAGTLTLSGDHSFTGGTTIAGTGMLLFADKGAFYGGTINSTHAQKLHVGSGAAAGFGVGSGAYFSAANIGTVLSNGDFADGAAIGFDTSNADGGLFTYSAMISNPNGGANALGIVKSGTGTLLLSGSNTNTGPIAVQGGTLRVAGASALPDQAKVTLSDVAGVTLDLNGTNETIGSLAGGGANGGNVTLGSGTLTTGGDNASTSFGGIISGSGSVVKQGTGIFSLTGANTFSGGTTISAGTLQLNHANSLADSGAVTVDSGATLDLNNTSEAIGSLTGAGGVTMGSASLTTGGDNTTTAFSGNISGSGTLIKAGTGTFTLTGTNTFSGGANVTAGTLVVGNGADNGGGFTGGIAISSGANLSFNRSDVASYSSVLSGSGSVTQAGSGTIQLNGNNTYTGGTTLASGTLELGHANAIGMSGPISFTGGTLLYSSAAGDLSSRFSSADNQEFRVDVASQNVTYGSDLASSGGIFVKSGTGTLTLSGNNTFDGATTINRGTLTLAGGNALSDSSAVSLANTSGVTLSLGGNETIGSLAGGGGTGGNVSLDDHFLTVGGDNTDTEFFGAMTGNNGGLTKIGTGTFTLSSSNTNWNGDTTINGGTLKATAFSVPWGSDLILANTAGVTFEIAYAGVERLAGLSGGGTTGGTVSIASGGTLQPGFNDATSQFDGVITGAGAFDKIGTGTLTLGGANTFTGGTTVSAGTLQLNHSNSLADSGTVTVASGTTLNLNNSHETIGSLAGAGNVSLGSATLTTGGNDTSTVHSGIISGIGGLTKSGTGTFTLSGANTYTGATTINAGTLILGHATDTLADTGTVNIAGGTLALGANSDTVGTINLSSGSITGSGTLTGSAYNLTNTGAISANLGGSAALTKSGAGTVTLSGANTYTGGTNLNAGTLSLGSSGALGSTGDITFGGGTLQFTSSNTTDYSGRISSASNQSINLDLNNQSITFASDIPSAVGDLVLSGNGSLIVTGTNSGIGATISSGSLQLGAGGTTGSLDGNIVNNGNLIINRSDDLTMNSVITGTGNFSKNGAGTLTVSDTNISGKTEVQSGTLSATGSGLSADSTYEVFNGAALDIATSIAQIAGLRGSGTVNLNSNLLNIGKSGVTTSFDGTLSGGGHISVNNGGQFVISGAQTLTGTIGTFGTNSVLSLDDDASFAANNTFDINDNSIFSVQRSNDLTLAGNFRLKDSAKLHKLGTGVLTLSGSNSNGETGVLEIDSGTLRTTGSSGGMFQTASVEIESGATLDLANTNQSFSSFDAQTGSAITLGSGQLTITGDADSTFAGTVSGTNGSIVKQGNGTLALSGNATHTGGTTVNAGAINLTGSAANSAFAINNGGTLSGTGTLGSLTVNTGGILSPGNSPGTLNAGNTVWAGDASFILELDNAIGTKGTNWDLLAITGTLTINATMANPFTVNVDTLLNGTNTSGAMANFDANTSNEWVFVETTGGINYGTDASIGASFAINTDDFANATNGTFSISQIAGGNSLALTYTTSAVPEPGSFALLLSALALGFTSTRRRRR